MRVIFTVWLVLAAAVALPADTQPRSWKWIGPGTMDAIRLIPAPGDSAVWFVINNERLYRSADGARTWKDTGISGAVDVLFHSSGKTIATSGEDEYEVTRIYESYDLGESFQLHAKIPAEFNLGRISMDAADARTLYARRGLDLAVSPDGGITWKSFLKSPQTDPNSPGCVVKSWSFYDVVASPVQKRTLFTIATPTVNCGNGDRWGFQSLLVGSPGGWKFLMSSKQMAGEVGYLAWASSHQLMLIYNQDAQEPYTDIFRVTAASADLFLRVPQQVFRILLRSGISTEIVVYSFSGEPQISRDGGQSWATLNLDLNSTLWDLQYNENDHGYLVSTSGGVFFWNQQDGWKTRSTGLGKVSTSQVGAGTTMSPDGTMFVSLDVFRHVEWTQILYRTTNFGRTWQNLNSTLPIGSDERIWDLALDPHQPQVLYALTSPLSSDYSVLATRDRGRHWLRLSYPFFAISFNPHAPGVVYGSTLDGTLKSTDGGLTFAPMPGSVPIGKVVVDENNSQTLYILNYEKLYRSDDGGVTFRDVTPPQVYCPGCDTDLLPKNLAPLPAGNSYLMSTYYFEIFRTTNGGQSWDLVKKLYPSSESCRYWNHCYPQVYAENSNHYLLLFENDKLVESRDAGESWKSLRKEFGRCVPQYNMTDPRAHPFYVASSCGMLQESESQPPLPEAPETATLQTIRQFQERIEKLRQPHSPRGWSRN